jgi:hypothetical protein
LSVYRSKTRIPRAQPAWRIVLVVVIDFALMQPGEVLVGPAAERWGEAAEIKTSLFSKSTETIFIALTLLFGGYFFFG